MPRGKGEIPGEVEILNFPVPAFTSGSTDPEFSECSGSGAGRCRKVVFLFNEMSGFCPVTLHV